MISKNINISRIDKSNPAKIMLHSADEKLTVGHISYWIEVFIESNIHFSILTRDIRSYQKLVELFPKYSILYAKMPIDVESVITAQESLESIFYTSNMAKNIHLLRFNHLTHIFIGSENSDQLSKINKSYRAYDEIYVSSQSQIEKFKTSIGNTGHLKFPIKGKSQLKSVFSKTLNKEISTRALFLANKTNVSSSFLLVIGKVLLELKEYALYLYLENTLYTKNITQFSIDNLLDINIFKDKELLSHFAIDSDFIVVDTDHVKVSLLSYNIPILLYVPKEKDIEDMELDIPLTALYTFSNHQEFLTIFKTLKEDRLKEERDKVTEYLLGKRETLETAFFEV